MIDGVTIKELDVIPDERGFLMEVLRSDDGFFSGFGQAYLTTAYPGTVKAWRLHREQDDNLTCLKGMVKLVIYDGRDGSPTWGELMEVFIGEYRPALVHLPGGLFHGWKCVGVHEASVLNLASEPYRGEGPDVERLPADTDIIPYDWDIRMG